MRLKEENKCLRVREREGQTLEREKLKTRCYVQRDG